MRRYLDSQIFSPYFRHQRMSVQGAGATEPLGMTDGIPEYSGGLSLKSRRRPVCYDLIEFSRSLGRRRLRVPTVGDSSITPPSNNRTPNHVEIEEFASNRAV